MAFDAEFISEIAKQLLNNKKLNTEQHVLYKFYYRPDKLNVSQLIQLLQIDAEETFIQRFIIQLWTAHPNVFFSAAKDNKYILKFKDIITLYSSGASDLSKQIKNIAEQLKFSEPQKPYHTYSKVDLPIPETPETEREIPTSRRIVAIKESVKNNQTKQAESEKKRSLFNSLKKVIVNIGNKISSKKENVTPQPDISINKPAISKPRPILKTIINAFSFIFRVKKLSKSGKSQETEQTGYDSPNWQSSLPNKEATTSSGYSSPSLNQSSGYSSPTIGEASPGYSSPSLKDENSLGYSSPSIGTVSSGHSSPSLQDKNSSGYSSPSITSPSQNSPAANNHENLGYSSPGSTPEPTFGGTTKIVLLQIVNPDQTKQTLIATTEAKAKSAVKRLFADSNNNSRPHIVNDTHIPKPRKSKKGRVVEVVDNQENVNPNIFPIPERANSPAGFWSSPSPRKCSAEVLLEQQYSPRSIGVSSP